MHGLTIAVYKDAMSVRRHGEMLVYGLTRREAEDLCRVYDVELPDDHSTPATSCRSKPEQSASRSSAAAPADLEGMRRRRGRRFVLEAYVPTITSYMETSANPSIKELDTILSKEGASYSSRASIKNMLQKLGHPIPPASSCAV